MKVEAEVGAARSDSILEELVLKQRNSISQNKVEVATGSRHSRASPISEDNHIAHILYEEAYSVCWLKTKGQNFKEFVLNLREGALHFCRPKSTQ